MTTGIYTHPYARGFAVSAKVDGFLSIRVLFWRWELWANVHGIGPGIDHVKNHWDARIKAAEAKAAAAEVSHGR